MYEKNYDCRVSEFRFFLLFGGFFCVRMFYIIVVRIHYSSTIEVL